MPTVLIVAASALDQDRLRLNAEVRDIRHSLQRSRNREDWTIESNEAATVDDLRRALLDFRPLIVHFAGHGAGDSGLCFEDPDGNGHFASSKPLARLFHHFKDTLKCVVMNACYSQEQGDVIRQEIDHVVGMRSAIGDEAARRFAVAFYDAIFAGTDFRTAFDLACTALDLNNLPDSDVPAFMTSPHLEAPSLIYSAQVPEIERVLYAYYNTPFKDRWPFTTTGETLSKTMVQYYGDKVQLAVNKVQVLGTSSMGPEHLRVLLNIHGHGGPQQSELYVRFRHHTVLIEWEASVGYWSIPVRTYLAMPPAETVIARVSAELDNYYNYYFKDRRAEYQSVALKPFDGRILNGYVERGTPTCEKILTILGDGNSHRITIEIQNVTGESDMPLITELLSETWLYPSDQGHK